ncbi:hypothetical protein BS78_K188500 [Paspalum vaginatum]|uniref:Uncharacterized protein n=1 Tax=Paspalum vaginatum TaxID=158149 RepID=A0A9W8CDI1_9POAL|nr:hypothetical protein BS78_K188500 [Paspalum vaginatum]
MDVAAASGEPVGLGLSVACTLGTAAGCSEAMLGCRATLACTEGCAMDTGLPFAKTSRCVGQTGSGRQPGKQAP